MTKILMILILIGARAEASSFKMSLFSVPRSLDPVAVTGSDSSHVFHNLYRGLYIYRMGVGLVPVGAKSCQWNPFPNKVRCDLNTNHKWSDGKTVVAEDYVRAFRRLVDPQVASRDASGLSALKNYQAIIKGNASTETLGVASPNDRTLIFELTNLDADFIQRLASPTLVPFRKVSVLDSPETWLFNGPYVLKEWRQDHYIKLDPNPHYHEKGHSKLPIEIRLVEDGTAALNLYQANRLDLVLNVPTAQIEEWRNDSGYFETIIPRFDYIGFGPALSHLKSLRKALSLGSDFAGFQKVMKSRSRPGCPGFPKEWTGDPVCINDDVMAAKASLEEVSSKLPKPLTYYFTKIPTDDLRRGAEFYQQAWKRNLNIEIDLQSREIGVYRALLKDNPPAIFRRGVALDRPTCLSALEMFESSSSDNEIRFQNKEFDEVINKMRSKQKPSELKKLCKQALKILYNDYALIPQGEYALGRVIKNQFSGLQFTFHGTVDLTFLKSVSK